MSESSSSEDVESVIPASQAARFVVYATNTVSDYEACRSMLAILDGLTVEQRAVVRRSKFASSLRKKLKVGLKDFPIVFIGGRYVGGLNEVRQLKQIESLVESLPVVESGVCLDCGGYKFLLDGWVLITCTACDGTGLERDDLTDSILHDESLLSQSKLYICLELQHEMRHIYMIYSVEGSSLATQQTDVPIINTKASIYGYPFMGCGVYDSKIVLAGGELPLDNERYNGLITFDMTDNNVNHKPFVPMNKGKFRPLVFQLNQRLYVFDRAHDFNPKMSPAIEFYTPALKTRWGRLPSCVAMPRGSMVNYACLVFGKSCLISVPGDVTVMSHANYLCSEFKRYSRASLPFTGMATFYSQASFKDFVMIYFEEGIVRVCKFDFSSFGDSQDLFTVKSGGEDMHGYFADFGNGHFSLTAFDMSGVYLYTFNITRGGTRSGPLELNLCILSCYVFCPDHFCKKGEKFTSVLGCFAPAPNEEADSRAEELAITHFRKCRYRKVDDDYLPFYTENMEIKDEDDEPYYIENMQNWSLEE